MTSGRVSTLYVEEAEIVKGGRLGVKVDLGVRLNHRTGILFKSELAATVIVPGELWKSRPPDRIT
jgi:hypothetical protein